jgi:hypothetical protein
MLKVPEVDGVDVIFGGKKALEIMPRMQDIPEDFPNRKKWEKVMNDWFFLGLKNAKWTPKEGVETKKALSAIKTVMGSFAPKHEHKEAAVVFMLSEWFHDVTYEVAQ